MMEVMPPVLGEVKNVRVEKILEHKRMHIRAGDERIVLLLISFYVLTV